MLFLWVIFQENACCKSMDFEKNPTYREYYSGDILKTMWFFIRVVIKCYTFPFSNSTRRQFPPKTMRHSSRLFNFQLGSSDLGHGVGAWRQRFSPNKKLFIHESIVSFVCQTHLKQISANSQASPSQSSATNRPRLSQIIFSATK